MNPKELPEPTKGGSFRTQRALALRIDKELGYFLAGFVFSVVYDLLKTAIGG